MWQTPEAITITRVHCVKVAGSTVLFNVLHNPDAGDTGLSGLTATATCVVTDGTTFAGFNDATVPASSWVWLNITDVSASVAQFHVTVQYTRD